MADLSDDDLRTAIKELRVADQVKTKLSGPLLGVYLFGFADCRDAAAELVAARAALSTPMQAVPLTPDELADKCEAWLQGPDSFMCNNPVDAYEAGFRAAESHHGITGDKHGN